MLLTSARVITASCWRETDNIFISRKGLNETINKYYLEGNLRFENQIVKVLVEGKSKNNDNMYSGYSEHNKLVNFEGSDDLIGQIVNVKIVKAYSWHLLGELVK